MFPYVRTHQPVDSFVRTKLDPSGTTAVLLSPAEPLLRNTGAATTLPRPAESEEPSSAAAD